MARLGDGGPRDNTSPQTWVTAWMAMPLTVTRSRRKKSSALHMLSSNCRSREAMHVAMCLGNWMSSAVNLQPGLEIPI